MEEAAKKETGHARHLRLKAAGICTACGKRKAAARPQSKGGGRYNECATCRRFFADWEKKNRQRKAPKWAKDRAAKK